MDGLYVYKARQNHANPGSNDGCMNVNDEIHVSVDVIRRCNLTPESIGGGWVYGYNRTAGSFGFFPGL